MLREMSFPGWTSWVTKMNSGKLVFVFLISLCLFLSACADTPDEPASAGEVSPISEVGRSSSTVQPSAGEEAPPVKTGFITEQILSGIDGEVHYSYYLPEGYDERKNYPMMVVMPGYDRMWFGEESSGTNLEWNGVLAWTKLDEDMIVVSAQLTDWGEKSARQAVELTNYFIENYSVDSSRIYAAGYSAGGETMSQAVSMRPDLYAAYLHAASQWDGTYKPVVENKVAVYIYMAENDEYYGSKKARDAYNGLHDAYEEIGWSKAQIDEVLQLEIPDNEYFNSRDIYNYHGGANILFNDESILNWILSHSK